MTTVDADATGAETGARERHTFSEGKNTSFGSLSVSERCMEEMAVMTFALRAMEISRGIFFFFFF
jgi:hypothetical protein